MEEILKKQFNFDQDSILFNVFLTGLRFPNSYAKQSINYELVKYIIDKFTVNIDYHLDEKYRYNTDKMPRPFYMYNESMGDARAYNTNKSTLMIALNYIRDVKVIKLLIDKGADVNFNKSRETPLSIAIANYAPFEIIELLIEKGADVNFKIDENGNGHKVNGLTFAFHKMSQIRDKEYTEKVIELMIKKGADIQDRNIFNAYLLKSIKLIELLLKNGAKLTKQLIRDIRSDQESKKYYHPVNPEYVAEIESRGVFIKKFIKLLRKIHKHMNKKDLEMIFRSIPRDYVSNETKEKTAHDIASLVVKTTNKKQVKDFEAKLDLLEDYLLQPRPRPRTEKSPSTFKSKEFKFSKSLSSLTSSTSSS